VFNGVQQARDDHRNRQIGIREAMIVTAVVAVVLGAAGFNSGGLRDVSINWGMAIDFAFLTLASSVVASPLILWMLFSRTWIGRIGVALFFVTLAAAAQTLLLPLISSPSPGLYLFSAMVNAFQSVWIILVLSLLRIGGCKLRLGHSPSGT
jgi:hypothetical protein